jgi:hypothetical protein
MKMKNHAVSEKLFEMARYAKTSEHELKMGRYRNGSYSAGSALSASVALSVLASELEKIAKISLKNEIQAETQAELLATIKIKIGD